MCEFVRLVKGVDYIQQVQELTRTPQSLNNTMSLTIEEAMLSEPVQQALNLGLNIEKLRSTTQHKMSETGRPFDALDDLLEAIFNEHDNTCLQAGIQNISSSNTHRFDATIENVLNIPSSSRSNSEIYLKNSNEITNDKIKINLIEHNKTKLNDTLSSDRQYLEEENRKLKDARLCKVCLDEEVGVVYLPCGHLVTCVQCAPGVNLCPMCRTKIKGFVRTYLS